MSEFDPLARSLNVTVKYLSLMDQKNLKRPEEVCLKTGLPSSLSRAHTLRGKLVNTAR